MIKYINNLAKKNWLMLSTITFFSIVLGVIGIIIPKISGTFLDKLLLEKNMTPVYNMIQTLIIIGVIQILLSFMISISSSVFLENITFSIRERSLSFLSNREIEYVDCINSSNSNQIIFSDSEVITTFYLTIFTSMITTIVSFVVALILMLEINTNVTMLICISFIFYFLYLSILKEPLRSRNLNYKNMYTDYFGIFAKLLESIKIIRIYGKQKKSNKIFKSKFESFKKSLIEFKIFSFIFTSGDLLISIITQVIIFIIGGKGFVNNTISIGDITVLLSYYNILFSSVKTISGFYTNYITAKVSFDRLMNIVNVNVPQLTCSKTKIDELNTVCIENVKFKYLDGIKQFDFNFVFQKGNIYLLKGDNGTGKTTFINIISSIYSNRYEGDILFNNVESKNINKQDFLKNNISIVPQEQLYFVDLFLDVTKTDIQNELLDILGINSDVFRQKMTSKISSYSGGEYKKLSLLSALTKKFDILLLDEPTDQLDKVSKFKFTKYLEEIKEDKIIIISSHDEIIEEIADKVYSLN